MKTKTGRRKYPYLKWQPLKNGFNFPSPDCFASSLRSCAVKILEGNNLLKKRLIYTFRNKTIGLNLLSPKQNWASQRPSPDKSGNPFVPRLGTKD
jgi:hypothetical protein